MREPEVYGLPNKANAVLPSRNNAGGYIGAFATAVVAVLAGLVAFRRRPIEPEETPAGAGAPG
jgi:formate dehydrogenase iron-sulfur subunit